jgi:hypothetical protein
VRAAPATGETTMRKLKLTLRTLLLTLALVSTATTALAYDFVVKGIYYDINGDEATVTYKSKGYYNANGNYIDDYINDNSGDVVIPETVTYNGNTYTVTAVGNYAFYNRNASIALTSISIPKTVNIIGLAAFINCEGLKNIIIPDSVTTIGNSAFTGCTGLKNVHISETAISIGNNAFSTCVSLNNIVIPNSVTTIGDGAFYQCTGATNLIIGESVTSIGQNAFWGCYSLISVNCLAEVPPTVAKTDFFSNFTTPKLYVPSASVEAYRTTYGWNYFTQVYGFGPDYFTMQDNTSLHGDTIVIPVSMQNESEITAFQTDIYLPEGFEFVQENGDYAVSLSDRKGRDHVIMANLAPDGALRVASYSPTLKAFKNNEGELFYFSVKVPEDVNDTYPIWLRNTILTTTDEDELYVLDALSNVTVSDHILIMGDVNADGIVTVTDVVETARYILNYNPEPFVFEAADMNGDTKITITDVVKIANLILDQNYDDPETLCISASNMPGDRMSGEAFGKTVNINLDNEQEYTALQMDLTMPEGMTATEFALTERASDLGLIVKDRGNGKVRVVGYTPNLKAIKGNEGTVLTFNVDGMMGDIEVNRIEMVNTSGESVRLAGFNIPISNPTALNEMTAGKTIANVKFFNLAGQQTAKPATGVTLVVTTYTDGTRTTTKLIR